MKRVLFLLLVSVFMLPAFHSEGTRNTNSDSLSGANQTTTTTSEAGSSQESP